MAEYRPMAFSVETERLRLRLRTRDDASWNLELLAEHEDSVVRRSIAEEQDRLAAQEIEARRLGIGLLTIERRDSGEPVGYCGLILGRRTLDEPEIAYELLRRFHGRGYATEAARAIRDAAVQTGRHRLWSTVRASNTPSFRVLEKIGFHRHHVERPDDGDDVVYLLYEAPSAALRDDRP